MVGVVVAKQHFKILNAIKINMVTKKRLNIQLKFNDVIKLWYFIHFYYHIKNYISRTRYDSEV